jgi:hypothetical protein
MKLVTLPWFCGDMKLPACVSALRQAERSNLETSRALFRQKAHFVDQVGAQMDQLKSPRAKAYMTCRVVLAAKDDFDLTPGDRNAHRGEGVRRAQQFFRSEATVGM